MTVKIAGGVVVLALIASGVWFFFFRGNTAEEAQTPQGSFGIPTSQSVEVTPPLTTTEENGVGTTQQSVQQKVFEVVEGPIAGATVVQTSRPTTTVARYVQQHNGHIFELALDVPGAIPRALSNTTIPGVARTVWARGGAAVILQYLDNNVTKTVYIGFPPPNATTTQPATIKFLPDGIRDITASPDGASVAYLLQTETGVRGYLAASDGSGGKELFTLPLKEITLLWPSQGTLFAYTKPATGVSGIAFSINSSSGAVVPLLHATGLTLTANRSYSYLVYQLGSGSGQSSYARNTSTGGNVGLSFDPYPERCAWGSVATSTLYCAAPLEYVPSNYLDMLHAGSANVADALLAYTFPTGKSAILAVPGGEEGGVDSTIDTLAVSPDEKYMIFVRRGDRSLWGVRL